jgi:RNA polymerase sigma-70 factor (ECF subfamily)
MTVAELLGHHADVDDVLQDVYVRIWKSLHSFDPQRSSPMTWMIVVARNIAIDRLRRRRLPAVPLEAEALSVSEPPVDPFAARDHAVEVAAAMAALRTLAPERAELLSRAYVQGQSREALAQAYGAPVPTIKTWIRRALGEVRRQLAEDAALKANAVCLKI